MEAEPWHLMAPVYKMGRTFQMYKPYIKHFVKPVTRPPFKVGPARAEPASGGQAEGAAQQRVATPASVVHTVCICRFTPVRSHTPVMYAKSPSHRPVT